MEKAIETSSLVLPNVLIEQIKVDGTVYFAVCDGHEITQVSEYTIGDKNYQPIDNQIVSTDSVLFPASAEPFGNGEKLRQEVQACIHAYVDVSEYFEALASYYVLLTWVYDRFTVLPYLRVIGEPGTGKSRFLQTVGALTYKSMKASGAISVASIFRIIQQFAGTLILDEADLSSKSDEYASAIKILNTGHEKGIPVLRQEATATGYVTSAYNTFCPKVIATRKRFDDMALESRCITEKMTKMQRRNEIPLNLPVDFNKQALRLRNKLLAFRFANYAKIVPTTIYAESGIEPRISHIISPMLAIMPEAERVKLTEWAKAYTADLVVERGASLDGDVVRALFAVIGTGEELNVKNIAKKLNEEYQNPQDMLTNRRVGAILNHLGLSKRKLGGRAIIDTARSARTLELLKRQYGIE